MKQFLLTFGLVAVSTLHAMGQDAYIDGQNWYGHEVDTAYIHFDQIRRDGDPQGVFAYAKRHLRTMTHFAHGQPVYVIRTVEVGNDEIPLVLVRRLGDDDSYWTDPEALSKTDPLASQKAKAKAAERRAAQQRFAEAQLRSELKRQRNEQLRLAAKSAKPRRRPIAIVRYWQLDEQRFQGKLVNANDQLVKIRKVSGQTIIVERTHLSKGSEEYVARMLHELKLFRDYERLMAEAS